MSILRKQLKKEKRDALADGTISPEEQQRIDTLHDSVKQQAKQRGKKAIWWTVKLVPMLLRFFGIPLPAFAQGSLKNESNIFLSQNNSSNMKSQFGKLNKKDFAKGILLAVLVVVVGGVQNTIADGTLPTVEELSTIGGAALSAAIAYVVKNLFTNSADQFLTGETK